MTDEDCENSQNFCQAKKPCEKCGKFGHVKFECRLLKPSKNKATCTSQHCRCKIRTKEIPATTDTKDQRISTPTHKVEPAKLRTVVVFDVPENITKLKELGSALICCDSTRIFLQINTKFIDLDQIILGEIKKSN